MDRASACGALGRGFESLRIRFINISNPYQKSSNFTTLYNSNSYCVKLAMTHKKKILSLAKTRSKEAQDPIRKFILSVMTAVFPLPGPAVISNGDPVCSIACFCSSLKSIYHRQLSRIKKICHNPPSP